MLRPLGWALLALTVLCASPAMAGRLGIVVRGTDPNSQRAAALASHALRDAFERDERYEVLELARVLGSPNRDKALRTFQSAAEMVQIGREAFDGLELGTAEEALNSAMQRYESAPAYVVDFKRLADTLMLLGSTQILRHRDKEATERLSQAYNIYPTVEPDWHAFNPEMRQQFQDLTKRLKARPTGSLTLNATPGPAEAYIDGRFVGVTPITVDQVLEGRHFIRIEKDGYRLGGGLATVSSVKPAAFTANMRPATKFETFDPFAELALKFVGDDIRTKPNEFTPRIGSILGADTLFVARVEQHGSKVEVLANMFEDHGKRLTRIGTRTFTDDGKPYTYATELAALLQDMVGGEAGAPPPKVSVVRAPGPPLCPGGMTCRAFKAVTLGVIGGVGLVSVGVGISQWVLAKKDNNNWAKLSQTDSAQAGLADSGRAAAVRGDVFVIGGGVLMLGAGLAALVWDIPDEVPALSLLPTPGGAYAVSAWSF